MKNEKEAITSLKEVMLEDLRVQCGLSKEEAKRINAECEAFFATEEGLEAMRAIVAGLYVASSPETELYSNQS